MLNYAHPYPCSVFSGTNAPCEEPKVSKKVLDFFPTRWVVAKKSLDESFYVVDHLLCLELITSFYVVDYDVICS